MDRKIQNFDCSVLTQLTCGISLQVDSVDIECHSGLSSNDIESLSALLSQSGVRLHVNWVNGKD
jgi:hypothetical protein